MTEPTLTYLYDKLQDDIRRHCNTSEGAIHYMKRSALVYELDRADKLREIAKLVYDEMRNTNAPRDSFTNALDMLDAVLYPDGIKR